MDSEDNVKSQEVTKDTRIGSPDGIKPGRPKGAKNKSTLLREALMGDFEEVLKKDFMKVLKVVVDQAKDGCRQSQKLLIDRVVPTVHAESDKDNKQKYTGGISITIGSLEDAKSVRISEDIVDVEYEELNDEQ